MTNIRVDLAHILRTTDVDSETESAALIWFYEAGTTTQVSLWADLAGLTPIGNPVSTDLSGALPPVYVEAGLTFKIRFTDADGADLPGSPYDDYVPSGGSGADSAGGYANLADLEAAIVAGELETGQVSSVRGYAVEGDGGHFTGVVTAAKNANHPNNGRFKPLGDLVHVRSYGAGADGLADDRAVVKKAYAASLALGFELDMDYGTYRGSLNVDAPGFEFIGNGGRIKWGKAQFLSTVYVSGFDVQTPQTCRIKDAFGVGFAVGFLNNSTVKAYAEGPSIGTVYGADDKGNIAVCDLYTFTENCAWGGAISMGAGSIVSYAPEGGGLSLGGISNAGRGLVDGDWGVWFENITGGGSNAQGVIRVEGGSVVHVRAAGGYGYASGDQLRIAIYSDLNDGGTYLQAWDKPTTYRESSCPPGMAIPQENIVFTVGSVANAIGGDVTKTSKYFNHNESKIKHKFGWAGGWESWGSVGFYSELELYLEVTDSRNRPHFQGSLRESEIKVLATTNGNFRNGLNINPTVPLVDLSASSFSGRNLGVVRALSKNATILPEALIDLGPNSETFFLTGTNSNNPDNLAGVRVSDKAAVKKLILGNDIKATPLEKFDTGRWEPTIQFDDPQGAVFTTPASSGNWIRLQNTVWVTGRLLGSVNDYPLNPDGTETVGTPTGQLSISLVDLFQQMGVTTFDNSQARYGVNMPDVQNIVMPNNGLYFGGRVTPGQQVISLFAMRSGRTPVPLIRTAIPPATSGVTILFDFVAEVS